MKLAPSVLAANFVKLGEQVSAVEQAGVDHIHFDVMDGHFVPNLSMGPPVLASLRSATKLSIEVHLMVEEPGKFVEPFIKAGADGLIVHLEVLPQPRSVLQTIRALGQRVGLAINPDTPVAALRPFLPDIDLVLCMTVFPGFGGQKFLPESVGRIRELRALIEQHNPACELEVDGGIDAATTDKVVRAGATVLVSGTGIFRHPKGIAFAVEEMRSKADLS